MKIHPIKKKYVRKSSDNQSGEGQIPPDGTDPVQPKPWLKFQVSLKALVFIHILIACVIGIWVQNQTFGMVAAGTLIACLLVVYVDEELLVGLVLYALVYGGVATLMFCISGSGRALRTKSRPPATQLSPEMSRYIENSPQRQLNAIGLMVERFHQKFGRYPDDSDEHHFYRELMDFDSHEDRPPLLQVFVTRSDVEDESFTSPLGRTYAYKILRDAKGRECSFVLIDPGEDMTLGGSINTSVGFMPDGSKFSRDNLIYRIGKVDTNQ